MENTTWLRQTREKPLFTDLIWSRPENKTARGKLLIIGGNKHGFAAPASAYAAAVKAGIGSARVLLPESLRRVVGKNLSEAEFAPSNLSGSFSMKALAELLDNVAWADAVLLAGDFGRNSETAIMLDSFLQKYSGPVTVADDALDYFLNANSQLFIRQKTLSVINLGKLQKLAKNNRALVPVIHTMSLKDLVDLMASWTTGNVSFITKHAGQAVVASAGKVSTTPMEDELAWQINLAAYGAVWQLQNPSKAFEALTTAIFEYTNA